MNSILIIGSSNKVSKALVELYAKQGFNLILTWNKNELDDGIINKVKERYRIDVKSIKLDLMDFNSHKPLCDSIVEDLIGVITTAGYYPDPKRAIENNEEAIKCININYLGLCSMINIISNTPELINCCSIL